MSTKEHFPDIMQIPYQLSTDISTYMESIRKKAGASLNFQTNVLFVAVRIVLSALVFIFERK